MNSRNITLFEHQKIYYSDLKISPDDQLIVNIEKLNISSSVEYFELHRNYIKATEYVGIFIFEDWSIQVLPKIDFDGNSDAEAGTSKHQVAAYSASENLISMLSYVYNITVPSTGIAGLSFERNNWFELLMFMFGTSLRDAIKRGIYREYISMEDEMPFLRGKWLLGRQIVERPHVKHKFLIAYDEYSLDNPLNRVLKYVVSQMSFITKNKPTENILKDILDWYSEVQLIQDVSSIVVEKIGFTRINRHYEMLFNLAMMFLSNHVFTMSLGKIKAFALMFDMNRLFERFLYTFISKHKKKIFPQISDQVDIKYQSRETYLMSHLADGKRLFNLQPDMLFSLKGRGTVLIADAKYKNISSAAHNYGVSQSDVYQMLAYASRFRTKKTILIYPQGKDISPIDQLFRFNGQDILLKVATINIRQPIKNPTNLIDSFSQLFSNLLLSPGD